MGDWVVAAGRRGHARADRAAVPRSLEPLSIRPELFVSLNARRGCEIPRSDWDDSPPVDATGVILPKPHRPQHQAAVALCVHSKKRRIATILPAARPLGHIFEVQVLRCCQVRSARDDQHGPRVPPEHCEDLFDFEKPF
jgi:hypothetical protein